MCTVLLGITNPKSFDLTEYLGYNIRRLRDNFRVLEVVLNRKGVGNGLCPLFFDGAINYYEEIPLPNDTENIEKVYQYSESLRVTDNINLLSVDKYFNKKFGKKTFIDYLCNRFFKNFNFNKTIK